MWVDQLPACAPSVHPITMQQVVRVESGGNPLVLHVNGLPDSQQPHPITTAAAIAAVAYWTSTGRSVDLGLAQINSSNLPALHLMVDQVLGTDPVVVCTNLAAGAAIRAADYGRAVERIGQGQAALAMALSAYNTGDFDRGFSNGYVAKYYLDPGAITPARIIRMTAARINPHAADTEVW
jgi:type IV secretion system protein VirB1